MVIIVRAALVLHNLLMSKSTESYSPPGFADETFPGGILNEWSWRDEDVTSAIFPFEPRRKGNKPKFDAESVRDSFADYFLGSGEVQWQWKTLLENIGKQAVHSILSKKQLLRTNG